MLIIVNPLSHKRKNAGKIDNLLDTLKNSTDAAVVFTGHAGHAAELVENSSGHQTIVVLGGDGTIAEAVNGMDLERQVLGLVPLGMGNSLAHDLCINSPARAAAVIQGGNIGTIDLISCRFKVKGEERHRYAVSTAGLGFVARSAVVSKKLLKLTGRSQYKLSACLSSFGQDVLSADAEIDGGQRQKIKFTSLILNNAAHIGNITAFPLAVLDDTLLNLYIAKMNFLQQSLANVSIVSKMYFYKPGLIREVRNLKVFLKKPSLLMLDGELFGPVGEVDFSVAPGKLKILR